MSIFGFATYEVYPTTPGGVGVFIDAVVDRLTTDGHTVVLLLGIPTEQFRIWTQRDIFRYDRPDLVISYSLDDLCADIAHERTRFVSDAHWASYRFAHALKKIHRERTCDFFEFFDYCGPAYYSLLLRAADPKLFPETIAVRFHNTIEIIDRRLHTPFSDSRLRDYALERASLALADMVLCSGENFAREEIASFYKVDTRDLVISPLPCRIPESTERDANARDVLFLGRLSTFKAADRFFHAAAAILSDERMKDKVGNFIVIGPSEGVSVSQSEQNLLEIVSGWLGDRVRLVGRLTHAEMEPLFKSALCAVFGNKMESFCYAAHEIYLHGMPLILSDSPTFRDHFKDCESALFFDHRIKSLVDCIMRLADDAGLQAQLVSSVEYARKRYQNHFYPRHLSLAKSRQCCRERLNLTYVVVRSSDNSVIDFGQLQNRLPAGEWLCIKPALNGPRVRLFGEFWQLQRATGEPLAPQTLELGSLVIFVDPARPPSPEFVEGAVELMSKTSKVGAVVPPDQLPDGHWEVSNLPVMLETAANFDQLIGCVMRVERNESLVDSFDYGEGSSELGRLFHLRHIGKLIVDLPIANSQLDRSQAPYQFRSEGGRILRRFAWDAEAVAVSAVLEKLLDLPNEVGLSRNLVNPGIRHAVEASKQNSNLLYIGTNPDAGDEPSQKVTLTRVFLSDSPLFCRWDCIDFDPSWYLFNVSDNPNGFMVSAARGSIAVMPFDRTLRLTFLAGPDQGSAILIHNGKVRRVALSDQRYREVTLNAGGEFFSVPETRDSLDSLLPRRLRASSNSSSLPQNVFVVATDSDAAFAQMLREHSLDTHLASTEVVTRSYNEIAQRTFWDEARGHASIPTIYLVFNPRFAEAIGTIINRAPQVRFEVFLRDPISWGTGTLDQLEKLAFIVRSNKDRVSINAIDDSLTDVIARFGAELKIVELQMVQSDEHAEMKSASVIISNNPDEIPTFGHIAASLALLDDRIMSKVDRIWIPHHATALSKLINSFGVGDRLRLYEEVVELLNDQENIPIYVSPWPNNFQDPLAYRTIASGGRVVVARGSLPLNISYGPAVQCVDYWEDAADIARAITASFGILDEKMTT